MFAVPKLQKEVAGIVKIVSAQHQPLNVSLVQFTHAVTPFALEEISGLPGSGGGVELSFCQKLAKAFCKSSGCLPWFSSIKAVKAFFVCSARNVCPTVLLFTPAKKNVVVTWHRFMYFLNATRSLAPGKPSQCFHTLSTACPASLAMRSR